MADGSSVFRSKIEPTTRVEITPQAAKETRGAEVSPEVPYTDYQKEHNHPYMVDHFKLGDTWDIFADDVGVIESYFADRIHDGSIANSINAIKTELKKMEKLNNLKDEERAVVKIGVLTAHIKFLMETDNIKSNLKKYAST